jgi:hypothetical protein
MRLTEILDSTSATFPGDLDRVMDRFNIAGQWNADKDGIVHVNGSISYDESVLPVQFGIVTGNFYCSYLTTLRGAPSVVGGDMSMSRQLTTLAFAPSQVGGMLSIKYNPKLTSLEHMPTKIGRFLNLMYLENIQSLSGIHKTHKALVVKEGVYLSPNMTNILGLALIPGISSVHIVRSKRNINFDVSHHDINQFQEELLDAGMKAQARL